MIASVDTPVPELRSHDAYEPRGVLSAAGVADRSREAARASAAAGARGRLLAHRRSAILEEAQDAATLVAIRDQERAGLDIVTDGEMRRESYSNRFATALDGVDVDNPGDDAGPQRQPDARCRAIVGPITPPRAGPGARRRVPAREHRPADQGHGARAVHDGPAGAERLLRRRGATSRSRSPTSCARRSRTCSRPASTSSSSTSRGWSRAPTPAREYGIETLQRALDGVHGHDRAAHLLRLSAVRARPQARVPLPGRAGRRARRPDLDRDRAGRARPRGARAARRQDDHPRRDRARLATRSRAPRPSRRGSAARCPTRRTSSPRPTAG